MTDTNGMMHLMKIIEETPHFFHSLDGFLIEIYMHMKILGTLIFLLPLKTVEVHPHKEFLDQEMMTACT